MYTKFQLFIKISLAVIIWKQNKSAEMKDEIHFEMLKVQCFPNSFFFDNHRPLQPIKILTNNMEGESDVTTSLEKTYENYLEVVFCVL